MNSSLAALFLLSCFLFLSSSTFATTEVQRGAEVTLQCSNSSNMIRRISWFHMTDKPNITQICSIHNAEGNVTFYDPAQREKYTMTSNISKLFLTIKKVDSSDGGWYFCGEKITEKISIFAATYLKIPAAKASYIPLPTLIMAGVIALFILLVSALLLKIHKLRKGHAQDVGLQQEPEVNNAESELTYAKINFQSKRRISDKDLHTNVVYAATR